MKTEEPREVRFRLTFEILEYWHVGSGRGRGPELDAEVLRSPTGLPFLPGRTVRGLVREGMLLAEESALMEVTRGTVARWFGTDSDPGRLHFTNATLGDAMEVWAAATQDHQALEALYRPFSSTAIDHRTSMARDNTLRNLEVAIPVALQSEMYLVLDGEETPEQTEAALRAGMTFVRGLGKTRRRGFGRVVARAAPQATEERAP